MRQISLPSYWLFDAIGRSRKRYWHSRKAVYYFYTEQNFYSTHWLSECELNALQAWTIGTSTDPVRMSVAWAQLIHIILVTFLTGNSFIRLFHNILIQFIRFFSMSTALRLFHSQFERTSGKVRMDERSKMGVVFREVYIWHCS